MASGNRSVLRGAFLLSLSGVICKILGAVYRIPLVRLLGDEGIGLYQMGYPIYLIFMALATAGLPVAVSKLVAERAALEDWQGTRRVLRLALALLGTLGILAGAGMAAGAGFFSRAVVADPRARPVIISLAPAVPLMAFMAAWRGYFQGGRNMLPSALSQLIEQVVRVATLLGLAILLLPLGIERAAAGAAFGAAAGGAAGLIFLVWWHLAHPWPPRAAAGRDGAGSYAFLARRLGRLAMPIALGALLFPLMQTVDSLLVPGRLQSAGYEVRQATSALGKLGNAWSVIHFPTTIAAALAASLVPAVSDAWARRALGTARERIGNALRAVSLISVSAAAGLWVLAEEIGRVLFASPATAAALRSLAPAAFLLSLHSVTTAALQGLGRTMAPVRNFACGFLVKVILTIALCARPAWGTRGAGLATAIGATLAVALSMREIARILAPAGLGRTLLSGGGAAVIMVAALQWARRGLAPLLPRPLCLALLIASGALIFVIAVWALGGLERADVEVLRRLMPPGRRALSGRRPV